MGLLYSGIHFWALAIGFASITARWIYLKESLNTRRLDSVLKADNFWGLAALLWIVTGLLRLFGPFDKGSTYYLSNHWFFAKMFLFGMILS